MSAPNRADAGFSLIEVVVSLTLLSVALMGLAGLTATAARRATGVGHISVVAQALTQQVNRIDALPYDSLALGATCKAIDTNGFAYTRCVRVDSLEPKLKQVTLSITPVNTSFKPVTEIFQRSRPTTSTPVFK